MLFNLLQLPESHLMLILNKMNPCSFSRVRRAKKGINNVVRENWYKLHVYVYKPFKIWNYPRMRENYETTGFIFKTILFSDRKLYGPHHEYLMEMWKKSLWRGEILVLLSRISSELLEKVCPTYVGFIQEYSETGSIHKCLHTIFVPTQSVIMDWKKYKHVKQMAIGTNTLRIAGRSIKNAIQAWRDDQINLEVLEIPNISLPLGRDLDFYASMLIEMAAQIVGREKAEKLTINFHPFEGEVIGMTFIKSYRKDGPKAVVTLYFKDFPEKPTILSVVNFNISEIFKPMYPPSTGFTIRKYRSNFGL